PDFNGAEVGRTNDLYVPMAMQAVVRPPRAGYSGEMNPDLLARRGPKWLELLGRLKPGVTVQQAQANIATLAAQLAQAYPDVDGGQTAAVSDRKSTRLNSSHSQISYAVFCLK